MPSPTDSRFAAFAAFFRKHARLFLFSLSFLTRLAPARRASDAEAAASCLYYPFVGAVLGGLLVLPLWLGLFSNASWVQAWLYCGFSLWLTRALHHDGLADVLDALGSGRRGEAFWAALKDSRIGAFGAVGICMALAGHIILAAACLEAGQMGPLAYAPLFGRGLPVFLALTAPVSPQAGLGKLLSAAPLKRAAAVSLAATLAGGFFLMKAGALACSLGLGALLLVFLARKAREHGGYNGDFFGPLIVCGELAAFLSACLFTS